MMPPLNFNAKCLVLVAIVVVWYYGCVSIQNWDKFIAPAMIVSYVLSIAMSILYFYLYQCKISIYIPVYALLGAAIPLVAQAVSKIKTKTWRGKQAKRALRWFYMPLILGLVFYVAMARFDLSSMCEWKMKPTLISAPTAFMKGSEYRSGFGEHMRSIAIWSAIVYSSILGVSLPVVLAKRFE